MNKTNKLPLSNQLRLTLDDLLKQTKIAVLIPRGLGIMPLQRIISQCLQVLLRGEARRVLEGSHPNMAGGYTSKDSTGQHIFTDDRLACCRHRQAAGCRNAKCMHSLANNVLAKHRP
ncbi:hypothetical protein D3C78_982250 [compost metagenome]